MNFSFNLLSLHAQAKSRLKSLEEFRDEHTKKTDDLSKTLNKLSADVDSVKHEINKRGSSITDTAPVVEIRAALQRLKAENKELDVRIGILVSVLHSGVCMMLLITTNFISFNFPWICVEGLRVDSIDGTCCQPSRKEPRLWHPQRRRLQFC